MRGIDPEPFGPASSRLYRKNLQAEALAVRLASLTGFHGLCGFDWVQCGGPDGPLYVIEFHPRPTLGFHMAHRAGVDFAIAVRGLLEDATTETLEQPGGREALCLFFPKDLTRAVRTRDIRGLLRWLPVGPPMTSRGATPGYSGRSCGAMRAPSPSRRETVERRQLAPP